MTTPNQGSYLFSKIDEEERARLNSQHHVFTKFHNGHVLHPSIPKSAISSIADIGTGTGIWLEAAAEELLEAGKTSLKLIGFDISSKLFPVVRKAGIEFELADVVKGFDEKYHSTFDVVHVRLFLVVLTAKKMKPSIENLLKLLKPGGYLQWDDLDYHGGAAYVFPCENDPSISLRPEFDMVLDFYKSQTWSLDMMADISRVLEGYDVEKVALVDYNNAVYERPELAPVTAKWYKESLPAVIPPVMIRSGKAKTEEEARAMAEACQAKVDANTNKGTVFPLSIATMVIRKKE